MCSISCTIIPHTRCCCRAWMLATQSVQIGGRSWSGGGGGGGGGLLEVKILAPLLSSHAGPMHMQPF